jgi:hypothetical protein
MRALQPRATETTEPIDHATIPVPTELAARCPVGGVERLVLKRVDGRRCIADIASLLALTNQECGMILTRLSQLGAVTLTQSVELDNGWDAPSGTLPTVRPVDDRLTERTESGDRS